MPTFFDPSRCPNCLSGLPARPLRCPICGVDLTGPTVAELVTTLRRADSLVGALRSEMTAATAAQTPTLGSDPAAVRPTGTAPAQGIPARPPGLEPRQVLPEVAQARSWFAGKSVGVILLVLGALCVLAAAAVFIAVAWILLPLVIRALILIAITAGFGFLTHLALRRKLQATAEAMAATAAGMFVLDVTAARRVGLPGLADLDRAPYEILAGALLATVAAGAALAVRSRGSWLWSLDAVIGVGMARAAIGALSIPDGFSISSVTVTVVASLLYVGCRHLRLPVARWSAAGLGGLAWLLAVGAGTERAVDFVGDDVGRIAQSWPALAMAVVAGLWAMRISRIVWRRVAACMSLVPVLLTFEIVGWSHGWVVGSAVMLVGFVIAALASARASIVWSAAVGGTALLLGVSSVVGLVPTLLALVARMGLAVFGSWRGPDGLPLDLLDGDVGPWLLPVTALLVLGLLPQIRIDGHRLRLDQRHTAGVVVATLGVLPMLYGAGFWSSMAMLVVVAAVLLCGARLWRNDLLLGLGLTLLVVLRVCAYYDDLANPLAWTVMALACLAWALAERRTAVHTAFLAAAGLLALPAAAEWLNFSQAPRAIHGLVIVTVGSLGLLASQRLVGRPLTRAVGEWVSITWAVVGLVMAGRSPSHRALEFTIIGVAAGITAYVSDDRRRAGWVSGVLLTIASWIRLTDLEVEVVEWYTIPAASALLVYGTRRLRLHPSESTWRCLGPGMALALAPSLALALDEPISWRGLGVSLASLALVALGVRVRLAAPFALGVVATALLALSYIWPVAAFIPRWTLLFLVGGILLAVGMTWESRVNDARTAGRYVRGLR